MCKCVYAAHSRAPKKIQPRGCAKKYKERVKREVHRVSTPFTRSRTGLLQYTTLLLLWFSHAHLACYPGVCLLAPLVFCL